jgi:hypothetical protein
MVMVSDTRNPSSTKPFSHSSPSIFIPARYLGFEYSIEPREFQMSKIAICTEIEKIYNNDWKTKGILPHNKVKLQDKILNNELPYFERGNLSHFLRDDLPPFKYQRIIKEVEAGWCSVELINDSKYTHEKISYENSLYAKTFN